MGLKVIVVGAGIGGLTSAAALRRAGCDVQIFEKSAFSGQIGAALSIASNGARVLSRLGFSYARARACTISTWETLNGQTMEILRSVDLSSSEKMFGEPARTVHRVDLHNELLRIATDPDIEGGSPVKLHLSSEVVAATPDGTITLHDGSIYSADLVIGADGLRSAVRDGVLGDKFPPQSGHSGLAAFRFLVNSTELNKQPSLKPLLTKHQGKAVAIVDTTKSEEHHIMWYPCRGGDIQNFVGIHPSMTPQTWEGEAARTEMRREYSHYHEGIDRILRLADDVKCWPLFIPDPYPTWVRGRLVLIGDAAHPMLPFGGQGSNMAIEDAGALGVLFAGIETDKVENRLALFEEIRYNRASRVQLLSRARVGEEMTVEAQVRRYAESPDILIPTNHQERTMHDYSYNIFEECKKALKESS